MSQVTIYVPEDEARAIRKAASQEEKSVSEWAREKMESGLKGTWPSGYFQLFGALKDETLQRPVQPVFQNDGVREVI